jgi:hypothetical protein
MRTRYHGKYTNVSRRNPDAIGRCDISGFMVQHSKLIKQMEYVGTGLVWTGYLVYPKFANIPNPQNLTPRIKADPKPILNPRPDNVIGAMNTLETSVGVLTVDVSGNTPVTLTVNQFANHGSFNFVGTLTGDIFVYVPNIVKYFYANNYTEGGYTLKMQLIGSEIMPLTIPLLNNRNLLGPVVANTAVNLKIVG